MRGKLLISAFGVVLLFTVSIVAFANTLIESPAEDQAQISETSHPEPETTETITTEVEESMSPAPTAEATSGMIYSFDWDADEAYLLAKIAMAEAEDQDTEGKALVILVVLNRVWHEGFPNTIEDVIYQKHQFSPISNGRFDKVEPDEDCWRALELVQVEHWDESMGALYFESKSESTWHERNLQFLFKHGDHYFYTEKE